MDLFKLLAKYSKETTLEGYGYSFREDNTFKNIFPPFLIGSTLKGKNLLPSGARSFLLGRPLFRGDLCAGKQREVTTVVSLVKKKKSRKSTKYIKST